jgi:flagellar biosynthetic protein FliR
MVLSPLIGITVAEVFVRACLLGVMMALPILASGLTLEMAFGMMMRAVPQIHMFVVGIPLKVIVGLVIFGLTLPVFVTFTERIFSEMFLSIDMAFEAFIGN